MINYTKDFIDLIEKVLDENKEYFKDLNNIKQVDKKELIIKVFENNKLNLNDYKDDNVGIPYLILGKPFEVHIKEFILSFKDSFSINVEILKDISKQIEIDYLLKNISKEKAKFYCSISKALFYYGIYKNGAIVSFQNIKFWKELIKKLYSLNLLQEHYPDFSFEEEGYPEHPDFNNLTRLMIDRNIIEEQLKEKLEIIDGIVIFKKSQEKRIVEKIEKKLVQCNLFYFLKFIFELYDKNKKINNIEYTIPYKYIINILIKNISKSKHKQIDVNKVINIKNLLSSFINLYQLKENKFETINITSKKLGKHLRNQVLYANFYPIYELKTDVLIQYINNIVKPSIIDNKQFLEKFGFTIENLIDFFLFIDKTNDNILTLEKDNIFDYDLKILEFYSVDTSLVNSNYSTIENLKETNNFFIMNPVLKYKNKYFIIGFKYFKMNFYNSLVEKIRQTIDKEINKKIGKNVDIFLERIFEEIKNKNKYEIFSGNYTPPKKDNPESDLVLKLEKDIIFFENKNKYLTAQSFFGSDAEILKDLTLSFVYSQRQLFRHERNIKKHKKLVFHNKKELIYNNENIIKISVSTNNWFNIMNNTTENILIEIIKLTFATENVDNSFKDANEQLIKLKNILTEISQHKDFDMNVSLNQTLFLPLELIVDKYKDDNFIEILKTLVATSMNTDNILHIYDYIQYIKSHKD